MKIRLLLLMLLLLNEVRAQQIFMVYRVSGDVKLKTGKTVLIGQSLSSNDIVHVENGASAVLLCEDFHPFVISQSGNHQLNEYLDSCKKKAYSLTAEYFRYFLKELTQHESSPESNWRKNMQNAGAVSRGCPGITIDPIFDTINHYEGNLFIKWKVSNPADQVSFEVFDAETEGKRLFSAKMLQNNISFESIKKIAGDNPEVYWNIVINGNERCPRKLIRFLQNADYHDFLESINYELKDLPDDAERFYATGLLLEMNHFLGEAILYYKKAAAAAPHNNRYQEPILNLTQ